MTGGNLMTNVTGHNYHERQREGRGNGKKKGFGGGVNHFDPASPIFEAKDVKLIVMPDIGLKVVLEVIAFLLRLNRCTEGKDRLPGFYPGPSTNDPETQSLTQNWVRDCIYSHKACMLPSNSVPYMPTRVLELRHDQQPVSFRLVQGSQCSYDAQYITLSHCWGPQPAHTTLRLLKSTAEPLSRWQPVEVLPKTFRDAVVVAGHFKVRYLWIDRLCIYQDSADDWRHESSAMQHLYRHGFLNVSALGAHSGDDGLFFSRKMWKEKLSPAVEFRPSPATEATMLNGIIVPFGKSWHHGFNQDPLVHRGWVLQERLLAPRVLYFGSRQAYWECRQGHRCEMAPEMTNEWIDYPSTLWKTLVGGERPCSEVLPSRLSDEWANIVESYTKCNLTFPSDKLVALSGLAEEMKEKLREIGVEENKYMAGIWEYNVRHALIWFPQGNEARRAPQYRAPTWSWAALDGPIFMGQGISHCDAHFVNFEINTVPGGADTGELTGGSITLDGRLGLLKVGSDFVGSSSSHSIEEIRYNDEAEIALDSFPSVAFGYVDFDTVGDFTNEAHAIVLGRSNSELEELDGIQHWVGLVLASAGNDMHRRIGLFTLSLKPNATKLQDWVQQAPRRQVTIV
ncbi:heterokaryon incompatibility protein [Colletotrichum plurivorum]|uniref:Heterokaryon incompatibility protein n=1 Tax=Colletotrichum plurivorum TaxID=2175906 RepID=A0A8H6K6W8_9PEZI|nr:heterokaryon incompatibility protein [Colletotrichum plurivorum]